jgi:hypothetical protein
MTKAMSLVGLDVHARQTCGGGPTQSGLLGLRSAWPSDQDRRVKRWRHLDLGPSRCLIECELRRLRCPACGESSRGPCGRHDHSLAAERHVRHPGSREPEHPVECSADTHIILPRWAADFLNSQQPAGEDGWVSLSACATCEDPHALKTLLIRTTHPLRVTPSHEDPSREESHQNPAALTTPSISGSQMGTDGAQAHAPR